MHDLEYVLKYYSLQYKINNFGEIYLSNSRFMFWNIKQENEDYIGLQSYSANEDWSTLIGRIQSAFSYCIRI